jgi:GDP-fucose transporter C1
MSDMLKVVAVVSFYWVVSISLVFLNKVSMTGSFLHFDAPIFMTWTQVVFAVVGCFCLCWVKQEIYEKKRQANYDPLPYTLQSDGEKQSLVDKFFKDIPRFEFKYKIAARVFPLTLTFIGMIVFNNLCLKYVQVSFYQVARSLTIVFNVLLSQFVLGEKIALKSLVAVMIVVAGYLIGCDGEVQFSWIGVIFGVSASMFVALYAIMVKRTLEVVENNSWKLMIYSNINTLLVLPIIFALAGEGSVIANSSFVFASSMFWLIVIPAGLFGFLINIATFMQIQVTSPLTHNISGTAKSGFQTVLAMMLWSNGINMASIMGNVLVLGGSLYYAVVKIQAKRESGVKFIPLPSESDLEKDLEADGTALSLKPLVANQITA